MTTIVLTIGVLGAVMFGMALGVVFAGKRLKGSCGGVGGSCECKDTGRQSCSTKQAA